MPDVTPDVLIDPPTDADALPPTVELHPDEIRAERWREFLERDDRPDEGDPVA
jgi:hypothetical protein